MRRYCVAFACAGMLLLAGAPGLADQASLRDHKDAFGPLDLRIVSHGHTSHGRRMLLHRVVTYGAWNKRALGHEGSYIRIAFTTDNDNRPDRALLVTEEHGRLIAEMRSWVRGDVGERVYGRGHARHPDEHTLVVAFRRALLGSNVTEYGWHVDSQYHSKNHRHCGTSHGVVVVCPDSAPNDTTPFAYVRHEL